MIIYIKNHIKVYELVIQLLKYLKENWEIGYIPNMEKMEYDLDIENEDIKEWFHQSIFHLINRGFIRVEFTLSGVIRISKGDSPMAKTYNFYDYHYYQNNR